jgi:putative CocE/NonD family hydrolase
VLAAQWAAAHGGLRAAFTTLPLGDADTAVLGRRIEFYQEWLDHERLGDEWWQHVDFSGGRVPASLAQVPPATMVAGWYDLFLPAQLDDYAALRAAGVDVELTVGPWTHASPHVAAAALRDGLAWFDTHLRDRNDRRDRWPVRLWVIGRDRWVGVRSWPPPAVTQRWHLHGGGRLEREEPAPSEPDRYRFDPADPTPGIGGPSLNAANAGPKNQRERERRADVVTWTSGRLPVATTIAGPLTAEIWLRSSTPHTDLSVRLCWVDRRGISRNLSEGILRIEADGEGGVRATGSPEWGEAERGADGVIRVRLRMWPTAVTVGKGRRLRVQVAGGAHPLFARNPGGGERLGSGTRLVPADHEILHDPAHPSGVELPISSI